MFSLKSKKEALSQNDLNKINGKLNGKWVRVFIPKKNLLIKTVNLPPMPFYRIQSSLNIAVEKLIPVPTEAYYFVWNLIEKSELFLKVELVFSRREDIHAILSKAKNENMKIWKIFPEGNLELPFVGKKIDQNFYTNIRSQARTFSLIFFTIFLFTGITFLRFQMDMTEKDNNLAILRSQVSSLLDTKTLIETMISEKTFLQSKLEKPDPLLILKAIDNSLPKSAWVEEFRLSGDELLLIGHAQNGAEAIQKFQINFNHGTIHLLSITQSAFGERFEVKVKFVK